MVYWENWLLQNGIWVIGERDKEYPSRLLHRLKTSRPPLLFGAGPPDLLNSGGICIVGSRNSPETALNFSSKYRKSSEILRSLLKNLKMFVSTLMYDALKKLTEMKSNPTSKMLNLC